LLKRIAERCFAASGRAICEELIRKNYSYQAIASILEAEFLEAEGYSNVDKFSELFRQALYQDFRFFPHGIGNNGEEFVEAVQDNNGTLAAVASLCTLWHADSNTYSQNPRIRAVVNFNFDAVLRAYVKARYGKRLLRTVERPSAGSSRGRTPVYHMHGFLVFDEKHFGDLEEEAPDIRVFTEQEYFDFFNRPNSMFNYTFLHLLREFHCLFIGTSLSDENIRRLLHYSKEERRLSYKRERQNAEPPEEKVVRHFALLPRPRLEGGKVLRHNEQQPDMTPYIEKSLKRLGTRVVWVEDKPKVSKCLQELYESTGDTWEDVS
jgi:hypothetical protein